MKDILTPTKADLFAALDRLASDIAAARAGFDAAGRLPDGLMADLGSAGFFRLLAPRALGGPGLSALDFMEVVERAASLDASVGWLVGNGGGMARAAGYLPAATARAFFADPRCFIAASTGAVGRAVPTAGGFTISGRWPFGSGSSHATWFAVLCEVAEGQAQGQGRMIFAYVPASAVTVLDTWHVSGLRATASSDFTVSDHRVAVDQCHDFQATPTAPGAVYRLPTLSIFPWTVATVPLGIANAAMTAFCRLASAHRRQGGAVPLAEREVVQAEVGRMAARMAAARAYLRASMGALLRQVGSGARATEAARIDLRLAMTHAGETASDVTCRCCDLAGAAAIFEGSVLERCERDVRAAVKHVAMSQMLYVTAGMARLGLDVSKARF